MVSRFVEEQDIRYPVGVDTGGKTKRLYGVKGIPKAFVIDPSGEVVWAGHPAAHSELEAAVKQALEDAASIELPQNLHRKLRRVADSVEDGALGQALDRASGLVESSDPVVAEQAQAIVAAIEKFVKRQLSKADARSDSGDYYDAWRTLARLEETMDGADVAKSIRERIAALEKEPAAEQELEAGEDFAKALELLARGRDDHAERKLQLVIKKYPDTRVADKARKVVGAL